MIIAVLTPIALKGMLAGSEISARWGRRMVMFVMSIYALCTAAITFSSRTPAQILAARILNCKDTLIVSNMRTTSLTKF